MSMWQTVTVREHKYIYEKRPFRWQGRHRQTENHGQSLEDASFYPTVNPIFDLLMVISVDRLTLTDTFRI